ncbi:hypothetical protein RP20_CCG000218 [Aedes albopictus]|nr:hypothetical protein RP20_CCG000218 [Aedes albopictus]
MRQKRLSTVECNHAPTSGKTKWFNFTASFKCNLEPPEPGQTNSIDWVIVVAAVDVAVTVTAQSPKRTKQHPFCERAREMPHNANTARLLITSAYCCLLLARLTRDEPCRMELRGAKLCCAAAAAFFCELVELIWFSWVAACAVRGDRSLGSCTPDLASDLFCWHGRTPVENRDSFFRWTCRGTVWFSQPAERYAAIVLASDVKKKKKKRDGRTSPVLAVV